jgi:ProP effector
MTDTATPQETQEVREVKEDTGNDTQLAQQAQQAEQQQQPEQQAQQQQPRAGKGRSQRGGGGQQQRSQKAKQPQGQPQGQQQQRSQRKVHPALEKLFALYPKMFGAHFLPLKLGVYQDLLAQHPDDFKKEDLKVALGLHARSTRYLEAVAAGHQRHDLQGVPVEPVAPEHVHHAILEVFKRRQARSNEDLRTQDETNNALLDEAVAELGRQAAKREALFRAFKASGRSEAEFAEMYGMDPDEVTQTLARVRADQVQAEAAAVAAAAAAENAAATAAAVPSES